MLNFIAINLQLCRLKITRVSFFGTQCNYVTEYRDMPVSRFLGNGMF